MQSKSSQMTPKTKEADRSSPVTNTRNPMAQQEPAAPDARVQPSANARKGSHQHTTSQGQYPGRGGREGLGGNRFYPRLSTFMNLDREKEHITQETSRETREADVQDGTTSRNIRSTHPARRDDRHHSRHGQTHGERSAENVRKGVDGGANEGEGGKREREIKEVEGRGNGFSTNKSLRPSNPVRNSVADEGGEGGREVKEAEGNELSTNQGLQPVRRPHNRRESARDAILRLEGTLRRRDNDVNVLSTRNEQLSDEIKTLKEELARLQLERDQTRQLLDERTTELSGAQFFLGKADTIFATDVAEMVDLLNAEVSQASNSIADSLFVHQVTPATSDAIELYRLLHKGRSSIGYHLCDILAHRLCQSSAEPDPMITQLALQAGLLNACHLIINDWNPPFWDSSSTVNRMYTNMRLSVGQAIAGRWRALARTYNNGHDSEDGIKVQDTKEEIREANADYLKSTLRDLLTIVGWSPKDDLPPEYNEKMRFLSDVALKLHETIGRGITSKDLIVDIIPCQTPFDPTKMNNADRQRGKPDPIVDTVACTVELGLRYKSAKPGGGSEETGLILKPKVLLASVLVGN